MITKNQKKNTKTIQKFNRKRDISFFLSIIICFFLVGCDEQEKPPIILSENAISEIRNIEVGDIVIFGSYEQDNNLENGQEPLEWIVLQVEEERLMLITKYSIDAGGYHTEEVDVTWETSNIRHWLNDEFYGTAFTEEERESILETIVVTKDHTTGEAIGGNDTLDYVFLLSAEEAWELFETDESRQGIATDYARAQGANTDDYSHNGTTYWWLRSPGVSQNQVLSVDRAGVVEFTGCRVNHSQGAVRPAIWVTIN